MLFFNGWRMFSLKNYLGSFTILLGIVIGGAVGALLGQQGIQWSMFGDVWHISSRSFAPIGQIFLNMMFVTIVPLVFFSITSAITKTAQTARLKRILWAGLWVFLVTAFVIAIISYFGFVWYQPLAGYDLNALLASHGQTINITEIPISEMLIKTLSAGDFLELFRRNNLLALIIFSLLLGSAVMMSGEKGQPLARFFESGMSVMLNLVKIIMYAAPIGLGCYFADIVGDLGPQIVGAYANVLVLYLILTLVAFFGLNTLYAWLAAGRLGVRVFWQNALTPALTAVATTSSAACIPVNLMAVQKMQVPSDIADTIIPLGANTHKDGSVMGGVFKILFLLTLVGIPFQSFGMFVAVILVAMVVGIVIGAIPSGGLTAEVFICTIFGVPVEYVGLILVISIIIDIPATLLNSTGNNVCAMLITRIVEGKHWLAHKSSAIMSK